MKFKLLLLYFILQTIDLAVLAQDDLWQDIPIEQVANYTKQKTTQLPSSFRLLKFNPLLAAQLQSSARNENNTSFSKQATPLFTVPLPNGQYQNLTLIETHLLSTSLQQAYPDIKTYALAEPNSKNIIARLTITKNGVSGFIFSEKGTIYISPLGKEQPNLHIVYPVKDLINTAAINCTVKEQIARLTTTRTAGPDCKHRNYRFAIAATGEYTSWAGSQGNAVAYITTTLNDITAIFERDLSVSFTLVTSNTILFTDANNDPYETDAEQPTAFNNAVIISNHNTLQTNIGSNNYDLGMVFDKFRRGGLAFLNALCNNSFKGAAGAGLDFGIGSNPLPGPQGPVFAGIVAHEVGHLFGATHTFSGTNAGCGGIQNEFTTYEPGAGSTIMAYPGICTGNSYQNDRDLYFHSGSIAQMQSYINNSGNCVAATVNTNTAPQITLFASNYTIPISTPFTLTANGTDADKNTLKYCWEQMDAGFASNVPPLASNTIGPNFRSYPPSIHSSRTFPQLQNIITGTNSNYEVLPSVSRSMNFAVTVRDEAPDGGCTAQASVIVNTSALALPFIVTSQNTPTTWIANGNNTATITWNMANSNIEPVNCSAVDILFSIDGGETYPYTLASNIPNNGSHTITIPSLPTQKGRIKIAAKNNIFFNINAADIVVSSICSAEGTTLEPATNISAEAGSNLLNLLLNPQYGTAITPAGQITTSDAIGTLTIVNMSPGNCINFNSDFYHHTYKFTVAETGNYTFSRTTGTPGGIMFSLYKDDFDPANPCNNFISSNGFYNGAGVNINNSITANLQQGYFYTLAVGSYGAGFPSLPANYNISTNKPIFSNTPNPGSRFNYTYVIVHNASGNIRAIQANSNLSNTITFPSGIYTVYGLSYFNSISTDILNSYIGGSFSNLQNDLLHNPSSRCGNLSKNNIKVTIQPSSISLPALLLPLQAQRINNKVLLQWGTLQEQQTGYFIVERSTNGIVFNSLLDTIPAAGFSNVTRTYNFTDHQPFNEQNYYRIRQVDLNGEFIYSNIISLHINSENTQTKIYPNPAQSQLMLTYNAVHTGWGVVMITDVKGRLIQQLNLLFHHGVNTYTLNTNISGKGIFFLKVTAPYNKVEMIKFFKQ